MLFGGVNYLKTKNTFQFQSFLCLITYCWRLKIYYNYKQKRQKKILNKNSNGFSLIWKNFSSQL